MSNYSQFNRSLTVLMFNNISSLSNKNMISELLNIKILVNVKCNREKWWVSVMIRLCGGFFFCDFQGSTISGIGLLGSHLWKNLLKNQVYFGSTLKYFRNLVVLLKICKSKMVLLQEDVFAHENLKWFTPGFGELWMSLEKMNNLNFTFTPPSHSNLSQLIIFVGSSVNIFLERSVIKEW